MSISSSRTGRARTRLGSPIVSVNSPGPYLRHRVTAERAYRARRRNAQLHRLLVFAVVGGLYLAIGHELLQLTRAKASLLSTEMRSDTNSLTRSLKRVLEFGRGEDKSAARAAVGAVQQGIATGAVDDRSATGRSPHDAALLEGQPR